MEVDDFDLEFADELDALADIEESQDYGVKGKRSLKFETPKGNKTAAVVPPAEGSPSSPLDEVPWDSPEDRHGNNTKQPLSRDREKRPLDEEEDAFLHGRAASAGKRRRRLVEEPDFDEDDLPDIEFTSRQRFSQRESSDSEPESEAMGTTVIRPVETKVYRYRPQIHSISVTSTEGDRFYLKLKDEHEMEQQISNLGKHFRGQRLLDVPYYELRQQAEDEMARRLLQGAHQQSEERHRTADRLSGPDAEIEQRYLWVERYSPHHYTDLLSDEGINRTLLHWLKLWDYVVFSKDVPKVKDKGKVKKWDKFQKKNQEVLDELDKLHRPQQKVVLLCGAPGLGKTTLAHVVARHAGYNVVEMNASDDRSVEVFKPKLEAATQMKAVLGDDPRPNCLVIDEIDGAPQATINVLMSAIQAESKPAGRKKGSMPPLMRPVICICNDQYVPSLRQLRSIALILNFPPTESTRLAARLSEIIRQENMRADMNTLLALSQKAGNDVRSCLNTLQFIHSQARTLTPQLVRELNVGQKDSHHGLFAMWQSVFSLPRDKKNFVNVHDLTEPLAKPQSTSTPAARFHRVLAMTQATGEYEKLVQGLFENYLEAKCKDPYLEGLQLATGWLGFVDEIDQYTGHSQDYSLMKYVSFLPVVFHFIYASFSPNRIHFPHSFGEYRQKLNRSQNLVGTLMADMAPRVRNHVQEVSMVMEVLPPLMDIIQPTLRPVNTQLYSAREKESLACLVHTMIGYNLTYIQDRGQDGQYTYLLEPNIEEVVRFTGQKQRKQLTYAARQLIAREIELEKMRRSDLYSGPEKTGSSNTSGESKAPATEHQKEKSAPKPVMKELRMGDFFQRFKRDKPEKPEKKEENSRQALLATDIWFHFTEGFTNAVRRNVKVQDFL